MPGLPEMKANTAIGFVIAGISLWLRQQNSLLPASSIHRGEDRVRGRIALICALIVALLGVLTLSEYSFNINLGIDQILFKNHEASFPGRMSPHTAVSFFFIGLSLLLIRRSQSREFYLPQTLSLIAGFIALLAFVGYAYGINHLYSITYATGMALHTATAFIILSFGILALHPDTGFMALIASEHLGGFVARRLLPVAIILPLVLGWIRLKGEQAGFYSMEFGLLLFAISNISIFVFLIWRYAGRLNSVDTERALADEHLQRVNKALKTVSECNMALVKAVDEQELLQTICNIIIKTGKYRLAWVGFAEQDAEKAVRPAAQAGYTEGYIDTVNITWADTEHGRGPTGTAIRTGEPVICKNILTDPRFTPWRNEAIKRGYASSIAIPLMNEDKPFGALNIYASESDAFDDEEVKLLMQLADDMAYGIVTLRTRIAHEQANEENRLLKTIAMEMTSAGDMRSAITIAINKICETTKWVYCEAWVPKSDGSALESLCIEACGKEYEKFRLHSERYTFPQGIGLPGRVWQSKKPEWVGDVNINGTVYLRTVAAMEVGLRAGLGVPITDDGNVLVVLVFYKSVPSAEDEQQVNLITAVSAQLGNLIQRKHAEEERVKLEAQLRHIQKLEAIGQLAGGVAHDFNNLLTAIIGNATLLQMKMDRDSKLFSYAQEILATSERGANLTKGLLAFSRKQAIDVKPVGLNNIIKSIEKLITRLIGEDIELKVKLSDKEIIVVADSGQIEQVLMNLATNARDAMPDGGFLSITTDLINLDDSFIRAHAYGSPGRYALITVTDTGMGMDEETKEKIFEPFFTTKEVGKGTGLGLSIVYGIVKQHQGYINVYSELSKGTTFKIYLPIIEVEAKGIEVREAPAQIRGTETVLIAEDEADVRRFTKAFLEEFGYKVIEAVDGEDAVNKFKENRGKIKLLILDVIMPKKHGKEAYDEIKMLQPDIKVIFASGYTDDIIYRKGILEQGLGFVSKPFIPTKLLKKVREALDK